jgi:acyl-CoA reductase-like NAD-dependent aldehyde dehydrogenase
MIDEYRIYCGGEFISTSNKLNVINSFSNEVIAYTYLANEENIDNAIKKGLEVATNLKELSSFEKSKILLFIADEITKNKTHLAEILCKESAKPITYALAEIERSIQTFIIASEETKRLPKEFISLDWTPNGKNKKGLVQHFPIGLVVGISPFNFPLNLAVHKIAPAIASGCSIILKPSSKTPLSTLELAKIIDKTDLPKGAVSILPCNRIAGNMLVTDNRIKLLSFTGSPEVGWKMKANSGNKKVVLELGGNAGVVITENCKLDDVIYKCAYGAFAYSGQICIHAQRFIVHENIFNDFVSQLKIEAEKLHNASPSLATTRFSVMIDEENAIRAENWVKEAIKNGANLICGGKRDRNYFSPTILTNCNSQMKVQSEEVFAPIITVESYTNGIKHAVKQLNDTKFGLQCGVFTDSIEELNYCFEFVEVGGVIHNDVPTLRYDHMPYGGIKESGLGREGVKYAIQDMMEPKILVY